jgi:Flp pilus assembly pilin Flp
MLEDSCPREATDLTGLDESGQDLAEYALLLALIALLSVASVRALGLAEAWDVFGALAGILG